MKFVFAAILLLPIWSASAAEVTIARQNPNPANVVAKDVLSLSIQLNHLAYFAGNNVSRNEFSLNLLDNLKDFTGAYPLVRVGSDWEVNITSLLPPVVKDTSNYGRLGQSIIDSYRIWSGVKFIPGLTLAVYDSVSRAYNKQLVDLTCRMLGGRLVAWELGNEPDLYGNHNLHLNVTSYVARWKDFAQDIRAQTKKSCPSLDVQFFGPSTGSSGLSKTGFEPVGTLEAGQNSDPDTQITRVSSHEYFYGGGTGNISHDLMKHSAVTHHVEKHTSLATALAKYKLINTIGETNSHVGGGEANFSNVFGAALWAADYSLRVAAVGPNLTQLFFHLQAGATDKDSYYSAWRPVATQWGPPTTKAPYFGYLFANRMIGREENSKIVEITLPNTDYYESMYVAYDENGPKRVAIFNTWPYNGKGTRHSRTFSVKLPAPTSGQWAVTAERLLGDHVFVTTGISFGGKNYEYSSKGKPTPASDAVQKASKGGISVKDNVLTVSVPDTEAVVVSLSEEGTSKCKREADVLWA